MRWYPSKVDRWIAVALAIAPLTCGLAAIAVARSGDPRWSLAVAPFAIIALVYAGLVFPMRYAVGEDAIIVRHGLVRQRIPLRDITEVKPKRN